MKRKLYHFKVLNKKFNAYSYFSQFAGNKKRAKEILSKELNIDIKEIKDDLRKTFYLHLTAKWFYQIKSRYKKEEYREITPYWEKRIKNLYKYDFICFCLGYPSKEEFEKFVVFKNPRFRIDTGKKEWGAEPGKNYFVIMFDELFEKPKF